MEGLQSPQSSSNAIYRLHNFDELVKRLNTVFILYQIPLSEGRPIVFDEFRCNHALNLRLLLSIRSSDLLESDLMVSNFELHDLGLRLPENPLNVNPTCDYGIKIRRAFQDELGTVFINTSLEVLGLATVLHVVERTISWLEPLLSPDGIRQVQANITAALQPSSVLSQPLVTICERSHDLQRQASKPSLYNNVLSSRRSDFTNFRADVELRPEFSAYNFDKEFPADALDRWVLEARSQGHEPTLMECTQKLKRLEIDYKVYRHERGYPPPPVSARYGYIDHALSRQYRESRATNQRTRTSLRLRPMQQPMTFRQEAEMLVAATTTLPRRIVPQKYYQTIANTSQRPIFNEPKLNRSQSNFAMLAMNSPASLPKTPRRRLAFTGSPLKRQNRLQITIGTPSRFTHEISGAGLKSWNEMAKAVEAANTRALHPPRDDSIQENLFNLARANSSNLVEGQVKASGSNVATKRRASDIRSPSPPQDTAFGKAIAREPAKIHKDCTDNACHRPVLASTAFDESMGEKARVGFEQQTSTSLEDRDAKVEALLTQLLLMQDVFRKARESLAASVGSQFIEKVTDIAVAYGWFRANFEDHVDNKTNKGDRTRSS
ncbi:MAG: hypothetical protein GOMPHAMPRED_001844 [Gomphillus americanus]|uniref:Uncharacterized protein n=1 Tax=Gomphillus americanus TaxID=1940652 RepID=A0A8H3F9J6_9LECA|nr:MAG: hypothetical protein GOMPHAMPRED_001844 [Gomphillus americanus]